MLSRLRSLLARSYNKFCPPVVLHSRHFGGRFLWRVTFTLKPLTYFFCASICLPFFTAFASAGFGAIFTSSPESGFHMYFSLGYVLRFAAYQTPLNTFLWICLLAYFFHKKLQPGYAFLCGMSITAVSALGATFLGQYYRVLENSFIDIDYLYTFSSIFAILFHTFIITSVYGLQILLGGAIGVFLYKATKY